MDTPMRDRLRSVAEEYDRLSGEMASPEVAMDPQRYMKLARRHAEMSAIVAAFRQYERSEESLEEALSMLEGETDEEMLAIAREERDLARADQARLDEELRLLLVPKDPLDERNTIVEIRAGTGGDEAALFAGDLFRMYTRYVEVRGWRVEVLSSNPTELGGYKEVSFEITGDGAYSRFKFESGVHRVQRVPETESQGRIQTSTATVAVLPEADEVEFEINQSELKIDTFRSSGAGGQHINKTDSAIRITHLPTGTVVECQDERSQHKNKERALKILSARLLEVEQQKHKDEIDSARRAQVGTGDRSERIRTYNFPQGRVSDHRIGLTLYKIDAIMNGNLDELIDALITADTAAKLEAAGE